MIYPIDMVANCFISDAIDKRIKLGHLKLHKLIYLMNAFHILLHDKPCVEGRFEAWTYGPIHSGLYYMLFDLKKSSVDNINETIKRWNWNVVEIESHDIPYFAGVDDSDFINIMDQMKENYSTMTIDYLSNVCRGNNDSPWNMARNRGEWFIRDEDIKSYFGQFLNHDGNVGESNNC